MIPPLTFRRLLGWSVVSGVHSMVLSKSLVLGLSGSVLLLRSSALLRASMILPSSLTPLLEVGQLFSSTWTT